MMTNTSVALVTGGGCGVGYAIALRLAQAGFDICVASPDRNEIQVAALEIQAIGRRALPLLADVRHEEQVRQMVLKTESELGPVSLLVNNAGVLGPTGPLSEIAKRDWDDVLAVNLTGAFLCCKAVLPSMIERGRGKIVNIACAAGRVAYPFLSPCAAARWGLAGFTQTLAREVGAHNIQVNAVCPGPMEGNGLRSVIGACAAQEGRAEEEIEADIKRSAVLGRFVREEDIAGAVAFLASPNGDNITGQTIEVTAGHGL